MAEFWVVDRRLKASGLTPGSVEDSIKKWHILHEMALVGWAVRDGGSETCALCLVYSTDEDCCVGCPVWAETGFSNCQGTPYEDYYSAVEAGDSQKAASAAERMVDFLSQIA